MTQMEHVRFGNGLWGGLFAMVAVYLHWGWPVGDRLQGGGGGLALQVDGQENGASQDCWLLSVNAMTLRAEGCKVWLQVEAEGARGPPRVIPGWLVILKVSVDMSFSNSQSKIFYL